MAETVEDAPSAGPGDEIKPYKVHVSSRTITRMILPDCLRVNLLSLTIVRRQVSSKYLELTRQKLELTRLPHEGAEPPSEDWWEPKPQVEPLIDFW